MAQPVNQNIRINLLRAQILLLLPVVLLSMPSYGFQTPQHEWIETAGIACLLVGVLGRFWSILYVGGRKNSTVVADGPYSLSRNPLYVFSTIATFGIGLMFGSVTLAVFLGLSVGVTLYVTARKEARFLAATFGDAYLRYAREVPFFLPRLHGYRSEREVTFSPAALRGNLLDAFVFLAFIPLVEGVDMLKTTYNIGLLTLP